MSNEVKRYDFTVVADGESESATMYESRAGVYVTFSDYEALERQWRERVEAIYAKLPHDEHCNAYGWMNADKERLDKCDCTCIVREVFELLEDK